jgi:hypothetical protein
MKKRSSPAQMAFLLIFFFLSFKSIQAQNVGINTNSPQAALDVKGNLQLGGSSKSLAYDSVSGKFTWSNSYLFLPGNQYIIQHSASAEGVYYNSGQLEYRNQLGNPVFFTNWLNGNGYFNGNLGIGTINPGTKLHVYGGASGATPFAFSPLAVESNGHTYINLLSPAANETAILFGQPGSSANGVIMYNNTGTLNGFQFRNNGNLTRMVINSAGNVGIGTAEPSEKMEVSGNIKANNYLYPIPKTFHYTISGSDFFTERSTDTVLFNLGSGGTTMQNNISGKRIIAPIHLPDGATMVKMTAYLYDASASDNLRVVFYRKTILSNFFPGNIGFVTSLGSTGVTTAYETPVNSFSTLVDNSIYSYYVSVEPENFSGIWISNMEIRAVVMDYILNGAQ